MSDNLEPIVQVALDAYDDGHRLIADWFNRAFKKLELKLQIDAGAPAKDLTLDDCRLQLANALQGIRPFSVDLPRDEQLYPWIVGYLSGQGVEKGDKPVWIPLIEPDFPSPWGNEEAILNIVGVKYTYGWVTVDQWRRFVVEPMEQQAQDWREWLSQFESINIQGVTPIALSDRQYGILRTLMQYKAFDCEHRMTRDEIAKLMNETHDRSFGDAVAKLSSKYKLTESKGGRNGGIWLSQEGRKQAKMQL